MKKKQSFVANDKESLAAVMADHELIASLGFHYIFNLPIVQYGQVLSTLNCLSGTNHFTQPVVAECEKMTVTVLVTLANNPRNQ